MGILALLNLNFLGFRQQIVDDDNLAVGGKLHLDIFELNRDGRDSPTELIGVNGDRGLDFHLHESLPFSIFGACNPGDQG